MRTAYKKIQEGMKTHRNLSQDRIEHLEEIGFQWQGVDYEVSVEKSIHKLTALKEEFRHCNAPQRYSDNPSLGHWCSDMRNKYKKIQEGMSTHHNLSQGRGRECPEEIGFQLQGVDYNEAFEKHYQELIAFKEDLDTAMFLTVMQAILHWATGVDT